MKSKISNTIILKTADKLITKSGIKGWNMDDLAEEAGITKRTLYKHIVSKEELIHEIANTYSNKARENILRRLESYSDLVQCMSEVVYDLPFLLRNYYISNHMGIFSEYPQIEIDINKKNEIIIDKIKRLFQEGIDKNIIRKDLSPEIIFHMIQAIVFYFLKYSDSEKEFMNKIKPALKCILDGIKINNLNKDIRISEKK